MLIKKDTSKTETKSAKNSKSSDTKVTKPQTAPATTPSRALKSYTPPANESQESSNPDSHARPADRNRTNQKTRIIIKYDTGFNNQLYIRGKGSDLNWEKGIPLKNVKADEWIWETDDHSPHYEFKVLLNDSRYETGENHHLHTGTTLAYSPHFQ